MQNKRLAIIVILIVSICSVCLIAFQLFRGDNYSKTYVDESENMVTTENDSPDDIEGDTTGLEKTYNSQVNSSELEESYIVEGDRLELENPNNVSFVNLGVTGEDRNEIAEIDNITNFAIFGTDDRGSLSGRSDIIMILQYNKALHTVKILSIPRDSKVLIPGFYEDKINHAYAYGGKALLERTIENLLEIDIKYYCEVGFIGFESIIDKFGGVQVNASKVFQEGDIYIEEGEQVLNGEEALYYVRFRYDENGDFGRIKRQQEIVKALYNDIISMTEDESKELIKSIYLNDILTNCDVDDIQRYFQNIESGEEIVTEEYTLKTSSEKTDGIWYERIDQDNLAEMIELFGGNTY